MSDTLLWELSRSSGIVAWAFLVVAVVGGALPRMRQPRSARARRALLVFHPTLSVVAVLLTAFHVVTIALDAQARLDLAGVLVPFAAERDATGVAWGVIALWLLAAATLSGALRKRLPRRAWTTLHLAAYPCAWLAAVHAAVSGSDMGAPLLRFAGVALVVLASAIALARAGGVGASPGARRAREAERPLETVAG